MDSGTPCESPQSGAACNAIAAFVILAACSLPVFGAVPPYVALPSIDTLPSWARVETPPIKRALVIGVGAYAHAPPLKTPSFDASLVERTLAELDPGFIITRIAESKTTRSDLLDAIDAFTQSIQPGDVAFVYFSGHGLERGTLNYLVPLDADVATPGREEFVYISLHFLLEQIQLSRPGITVVILDACRRDPFAGFDPTADELPRLAEADLAISGVESAVVTPVAASAAHAAFVGASSPGSTSAAGLHEIRSPDGFYVAYAAAPGSPSFSLFQGDDPKIGSIFTRRLLDFLVSLNKPFFSVLDATQGDVARLTGDKQRPFLNTFNAGEILLSKNPHLEADEQEFWIRTVSTPPDRQRSAIQTFLDIYPAGPYAAAARKRLAELMRPPASAALPAASVAPAAPVVVSGALRSPAITQANASVAIAAQDVFVRASPKPSFPGILATLHKGEEVTVLTPDARPGWAKIALRNGTVGYVGSVAAQVAPGKLSDLQLTLTGDQVPDVVHGPFADRWQSAFRLTTAVIYVNSGRATAETAWGARKTAYLRALRIRDALVAQGAASTRVAIALDDGRLAPDTNVVFVTKLSAP